MIETFDTMMANASFGDVVALLSLSGTVILFVRHWMLRWIDRRLATALKNLQTHLEQQQLKIAQDALLAAAHKIATQNGTQPR